MSSRIEEIEMLINDLIDAAAGEALSGTTSITYQEVLDVEVPPTVFPCSTLLFSFPNQKFLALGGELTENEWRWIQRSYFDNTDPATAQREMKRLLPALMYEFRHVDREALILTDGTQIMLDIEDAGDPNVAEFEGQSILIKALNLVAKTEEL